MMQMRLIISIIARLYMDFKTIETFSHFQNTLKYLINFLLQIVQLISSNMIKLKIFLFAQQQKI